MKSRQSPSDAEQAQLDEIRTRFTYAMNEWRDIRAEAKQDMRYVAGNPWSDADRKQREDAGRPCLSLDELHQYFNQLINDIRANPRAPKFDPTGNGANEQTARFYADKYREIEYRSQAQIAYTTAFQNAVHQSYGWLKFNTKWQPKSFVQDLWIEECPNPDLIVSDPDALRPSSSDQKYLFDLSSLSVKEFTRDFPDAQITSFTPEIVSQAPAWISNERVQIAKYWMVESVPKTLLLLRSPEGQTQAFYQDDLERMPAGWVKVNERVDEVPSVCMYLTNGVELLTKPGQKDKKVPWAGKYIPYVSCFGMVIYVDEGSGPKRKILSMTRLAQDPYMLYCYYRTCQAELVGMTPKVPYFVRRGSLKPDQLLALQKSVHEPIAVIQVESFVDGMPQGAPPEFPMRNPFEPYIQNLEIGAESARRAIQAAMGVSPLPTQAQRRNDKSGIALQQIESSEQKGSFHFIDHFDEMLQHSGVIYEDLVDKVYDTARETGVRDAQGNGRMMRINDPQAQGDNAIASIQGDHTVTISTGPAFESQRAEGAAFTDTLVSNIQMVAGIAGPKVASAMLGIAIKMKNLGELGDELSDLVTPPEFQQKTGTGPGIPPQIQAQMQQLEQENQQLKQVLGTKQAEVQAKGQIEIQKTAMQEQGDSQRADAQRQTDYAKAELQAATTLGVAQAKADAENFRSFTDAIEAKVSKVLDLHMARTQQMHEAQQSQLDRTHEMVQALVGHQQAMQQSQMGHQQALAQGQQAADLAPQPSEGQA